MRQLQKPPTIPIIYTHMQEEINRFPRKFFQVPLSQLGGPPASVQVC